MFKFIKNLYLPNRFFYGLGVVVILFILGYSFPIFYPVAQTALVLYALLCLADAILLFSAKTKIPTKRILPNVFSLSDDNKITIELANASPFALGFLLIDEIPDQFQKRDFQLQFSLAAAEQKSIVYYLRPVERGEYIFHHINVFINSQLGLVRRKIAVEQTQMIPVYPSIIQMKKFELIAFSRVSTLEGLKKQRRIGHSYEFEQIKTYVRGDDYRSINWKATSRRSELMVNQYEDEKAQQIYNIIDKSRNMKMPFNGLSLLDYAINTALVISNIALKKSDRAGLISFADKLGSAIKADRKASQLQTILNALYHEQEHNNEANYELLYQAVRNLVAGRSLIFLYTNFESMYAMERVLPLLRKISRQHLLVLVFFKNTEIIDYMQTDADSTEEIYQKTIAQKFVVEKTQIVHKLRQYGIQSILTAPEELSMNTVNKYLELKSRGLI